MSARRVVVTGRAVCSPLGCDWPSFAEAVRAGNEASLAPFPGTDVLCYPLSDDVQSERSGRGEEPLGALATACVRQALSDARIESGAGPLDDVGLVMNTALGTSGATEAYLERLRERGPRAARPAQFVDTLLSMPASRVGIALGLRGSTAVLGGSSAFELAIDWVRHGRSPVVVAGGAEFLSPKTLRYYDRLIERSGAPRTKLAQAAAFGVLEDAEHAERRGARPLAELLGSGGASEGQEVSLPWGCDREGRAQAAAIREALDDASIAPAELRAVCLAAGDDVSEQAELNALRSVLGDSTAPAALLRPKRRGGESLAASQGIALLTAAAALEGSGSIALVNAFEMGGGVSSLVVRVP
jgi:3-oxoacyl-[acyl-carrier-protein] synthase II